MNLTIDRSNHEHDVQHNKDPLSTRVPQVEVAATLVLGAAATAAASLQLGVVVWAVGILLSLQQMRIRHSLTIEMQPVRRLAEIVDLSSSCDIASLDQLIQAYTAIPESEFAAPREEVINCARDELTRLRTEKTSHELPTGVYYQWLLPMLDEARRGQTIHALSMMMTCEWDNSPAEQRFIEGNFRAAKRGVFIDRIFVMPADALANARENPAILCHFTDQQPRLLRGHFVDRDRLLAIDPALAARLGDGFISFDDRVALIDLHSTDGAARGKVNMRASEMRALKAIFAELLVHSQPLAPELIAAAATSQAA